MTPAQAREKIRLLKQEVIDRHAEINLLVDQVRELEAMEKVKEYIGFVNVDEVYALALIAEGKEQPA